jgi:S-adenosylmethionine uptake transporter
VIAPFEYASLPINMMWGFLIWHEVPTWMTLAGAALTLLSGLYIFYHEQKTTQNPIVIDNAALENEA